MPTKVPIDHFSAPLQFNIDGEDSIKTWTGFTITLAFFGAITALFIYELTGLFQRNNVVVNSSDSYELNPPLTSVSDFKLAIMIAQIDNDTPNFGAAYVEMSLLGATSVTPIPSAICTPAQLAEFPQQIIPPGFLQHRAYFTYCPDLSAVSLHGTRNNGVYSGIVISVDACPAGCAATAGGPGLWTSTVLAYYVQTSVDARDTKNPFREMIAYDMQPLSWNQEVLNFYSIKPISVKSDLGYLVSQIDEKEIRTIDEINRVPQSHNSKSQFIGVFTLSTKSNNYTRTFEKLQDVLGQIVGLVGAVSLLFSVILNPYLSLKKKERMVNLVLKPKPEIKISFGEYLSLKICGNKGIKAKLRHLVKEAEKVDEAMDAGLIARHSLWINTWQEKIESQIGGSPHKQLQLNFPTHDDSQKTFLLSPKMNMPQPIIINVKTD